MGKFIFRLESLLNIKIQMEESLKNELGKAIQKLEHEKAVFHRLEAERDDCMFSIRGESTKGVSIGKLREFNNYLSYLAKRMEIQKENINFAQINADKYREQLIKAVQEREMLEKLKEKKHREYLKELQKDEQKSVDELVSYNYTNPKE